MTIKKSLLIIALLSSSVANASLAQKVRNYLNKASQELHQQGLPAEIFVIARIGLGVDDATVLKGSIEPVVNSLKKAVANNDVSLANVLPLIPKSQINQHRKLSFTHGGIAYRAPNNDFRVAHILTGFTGRISLYDNSLEEFYASNTVLPPNGKPRAFISSLKPHVQKGVLNILRSNNAFSVIKGQYNILSNPYSLTEQNSTQFVTEIIAAGLSSNPRKSRALAFQELKKLNYQPTLVHIKSSKLRLGKTFDFFAMRLDTSTQYGKGAYGNIFYVNTILALRLMLQRNKLFIKEYHVR